MGEELPPELDRLLDATEGSPTEETWEAFVQAYSRLILHTLREQGGEYDAVMDRYAYVLEHLRRDNFRKLRGYRPDGRCRFSTWLVVVVHRLGIDHYRARYGGPAANPRPGVEEVRATRRRLVDLVSERVDPANLGGREEDAPDAELRAGELRTALEEALGELEPRDRLILHLRYALDLPASRVADLLRLPTPFHVYRRCNALCDRLRTDLSQRGVRDPIP